jgi:hypothetical protein
MISNFYIFIYMFKAIYIAVDFGTDDEVAPRFQSPIDALFNLFTMSIGEFAPMYTALARTKYYALAEVL